MRKKIIGIIFVTLFMLMINLLSVYAEEEQCSCSHGSVLSEQIQTYSNTEVERNNNIVKDVIVNPTNTNTYPVFSESLNLSASKYFPIIGDQVGGCCAAWATTYYQFTYQVAKLNNWNAKDEAYVFSPKYPYNYLNHGDKKEGVYIVECYNFLALNGSLRWSDYPNDDEDMDWYAGKDDTETRSKLRQALNNKVTEVYSYRIKNYIGSTIVTDKDSYIIDYIKNILNDNKLVTFASYTDGWHYDTKTDETKVISYVIDPGTDTDRSTHALTIVGYDDNISYDIDGINGISDNEKGAFLVANSWGTDWGNTGFIWIMYDALNEVSSVTSANKANRIGVFEGGYFFSIEVANASPKLTVELKIEQSNRNDIEIELGASETTIDSFNNIDDKNKFYYFINSQKGNLNHSGTSGTSTARIFVLDYSKVYIDNTTKYWLNVTDINGTANNTKVNYVKWYDSSYNEIKSNNTSYAINASGKVYDSAYPVQSVSLNKTNETLYINDESNLIHTILPTNATNKKVSWSSSNNNVATVDESGNVKAVGKGTAIITVNALDGSGKTASCTYTVKKAVSNIVINGFNNDLYIKETNQLSATVYPADADDLSVKWTSSNPNVVKVSASGLVTCVGTGTAVIRVEAKDGRGAYAECTYTITDDFSSIAERAYEVFLYDSISGEINEVYDTDVFKFTPSETGIYTIFTEGDTDTYCFIYDDEDLLDYIAVDDESGVYENFAHKIQLVAGKTYYIEVMEFRDGTGPYTLKISKNVLRVDIPEKNPDARHVDIIAEASSLYDTLELYIGSAIYKITKPETGDYDATFGNVRIKVSFEYANNNTVLIWRIVARITPTEIGEVDGVGFVFYSEDIVEVYETRIGIVAYKSTVLTGVEAGSKLVDLVTELDSSDEYELAIKNWDNSTLVYTSTDCARTGLKIIKRDIDTGKIVEIYYLVIYGDVTGGDQVGDGYVTAADQLAVLQDASKTKELTGTAALAADVNHDGIIDASDALLISQCAAKLNEIDQDYEITVVPDDCYYLDPVAF